MSPLDDCDMELRSVLLFLGYRTPRASLERVPCSLRMCSRRSKCGPVVLNTGRARAECDPPSATPTPSFVRCRDPRRRR